MVEVCGAQYGLSARGDCVIVRTLDPLKLSDVRWLHFEVFNAIQI